MIFRETEGLAINFSVRPVAVEPELHAFSGGALVLAFGGAIMSARTDDEVVLGPTTPWRKAGLLQAADVDASFIEGPPECGSTVSDIETNFGGWSNTRRAFVGVQ